MNAARPIAWSVSEHAASRYCKRIDPRMTPVGASILLHGVLPLATLLPEPTLAGQQRWLLPSGDAIVVAKPDPKIRAHVAVTVLGPNEMHDVDAVDDVVEAFQRATSPVSAPEPMPPARVRVVDVAPRPAKDPAQPSGRLAAALNEAAQLRVALTTRTARIQSHADAMEADCNDMKRMLRVAVIALRAHDTPVARAALADMEAMQAGITDDTFCYPERYTKAERRAAKEAAEAAARAGAA